jgi:hypothetical protein
MTPRPVQHGVTPAGLGQEQAVTGRKFLQGTPEFLGEVNRGPQTYRVAGDG